ncbi:MAG TPA: hypothetical protein PKA51_14155, partial [Kiritimatiellia bacterium]|nr:hypothetical protein [Kiritimatiellia bacterium]
RMRLRRIKRTGSLHNPFILLMGWMINQMASVKESEMRPFGHVSLLYSASFDGYYIVIAGQHPVVNDPSEGWLSGLRHRS